MLEIWLCQKNGPKVKRRYHHLHKQGTACKKIAKAIMFPELQDVHHY